jgi:hypothetical protein
MMIRRPEMIDFQFYTVQISRKISGILDFFTEQNLISYQAKILLYRAKIHFLPSKYSFLIEQSIRTHNVIPSQALPFQKKFELSYHLFRTL